MFSVSDDGDTATGPRPGQGARTDPRSKEHAQEQGRARGGTGEARLDGGRGNARAAAGPRTCAP